MRPTKRLEVTLACMTKVSREPSTNRLTGAVDQICGAPAVARETLRVFDLLGRDGL
jgi:hypothetical protein